MTASSNRETPAPSSRPPAESRRGVFVVFEGIDGAGTSTQAERYAEHLRAARRMVRVTREPSSGPVGSLLRLMLTHRVSLPSARQAEVMALLFSADRLDHLGAEIEPLLRDGYVVISDRYDLSSLAYQSTTAADGSGERGDFLQWIRELNRHALRPDVTVVIDVAPEIAEKRRRARGGAEELFEQTELQARLAEAYRRAEELVPGDRVIHIDGGGPVEEVAREIAAALGPIVER
ncbi:thymidylate kinase [Sorangium cellulosum]|uniref:Thymidylate kinase n=1 Tax=Sorangium cellulosum TaxID=56 RepID=A0A150P944_SORCE|nr:thymidylate kinase [Sorangium cellulosum]